MEVAYAIPVSLSLVWGGWLVAQGQATLGRGHRGDALRRADRRPGRPAASPGWTRCRSARPPWPGSSASSRCPRTGRARTPSRPTSTCGSRTSASPTARTATCCTASTSTCGRASGSPWSGRPAPGKSTLGRLLAGIHPPRTGRVTVGDVPLVDLPLDDLRGHVVLVTQEHHVFVGTVAENLLLARPDADEDALREALAAVDALAWVLALPDGLDTEVGSGGRPLTPAQAQQLALARIVLADPHTLVLDEATSLIDPRAARHLERSLARRARRPDRRRHRAPAAHRARRRPGRGGRGRRGHRARRRTTSWSRRAAPTPPCGSRGAATRRRCRPGDGTCGRNLRPGAIRGAVPAPKVRRAGPAIGAGEPAPPLGPTTSRDGSGRRTPTWPSARAGSASQAAAGPCGCPASH